MFTLGPTKYLFTASGISLLFHQDMAAWKIPRRIPSPKVANPVEFPQNNGGSLFKSLETPNMKFPQQKWMVTPFYVCHQPATRGFPNIPNVESPPWRPCPAPFGASQPPPSPAPPMGVPWLPWILILKNAKRKCRPELTRCVLFPTCVFRALVLSCEKFVEK